MRVTHAINYSNKLISFLKQYIHEHNKTICRYRQLVLVISTIGNVDTNIACAVWWYRLYHLSISTNSIVHINNSNCRYQQIVSITDIKYYTQYINDVHYQQFEVSISTMRFVYIYNLYCWFLQFEMSLSTIGIKWRFHLPYWSDCFGSGEVRNVPFPMGTKTGYWLPRLRVILLYTTGTIFR